MRASSSGLCLDASFEQAARLEDGRNVRLRWIRPADAELLREGFTRLSETLSVAARERGIETFEMSVLVGNWRVREFLRNLHAEFRGRDGGRAGVPRRHRRHRGTGGQDGSWNA